MFYGKVSILLTVELFLGHTIRPFGPLRKVIAIEEVTVHFQIRWLGVHQWFKRIFTHGTELPVGLLVELKGIAIGLGATSASCRPVGRLVIDLLDGTTNGIGGHLIRRLVLDVWVVWIIVA